MRALGVALLLLALGPAATLGAEPTSKSDAPPAKVNINTASAAELEKLPGIGRHRAEMIVRVRGRGGPFRSVEELRALPRLTNKAFGKLKPLVSVGEPAPPQAAKPPAAKARVR